MKSKVIGIMSFKGGVGKTLSSINIAASLKLEGKEVLIIDGNFLSPNLHLYLGLLNPEVTLKEVIRQKISPQNGIYEHKSGIHIMPCNFYKGIDFEKFAKIVDELKERYDYIILDSGPSYTEEIIAVLMVCDEVFFVATPDYPTLAATVKATNLAKYKDVLIKGIIINRKRRRSFEVSTKDIEATSGIRVVAEIPDDNKMIKSVKEFSPVVWKYPRAKSSRAYRKLVSNIIRYG